VVGITRTTRDAIAAAIAQGFAQGLSPSQIGDLIEDLPAFNEARAELVARTETMFAYNQAALDSYTELGVESVEAIDGDQDEECAARNGQTFTLDEAAGIEDHPNGTLDWVPVFAPA
jgi:SPP1 gp7 family putative phage head morphogenesis protein